MTSTKPIAPKTVWFCVQCRRPFDGGRIYKVGRTYLCEPCWAQMATEFIDCFGLPPSRESYRDDHSEPFGRGWWAYE